MWLIQLHRSFLSFLYIDRFVFQNPQPFKQPYRVRPAWALTIGYKSRTGRGKLYCLQVASAKMGFLKKGRMACCIESNLTDHYYQRKAAKDGLYAYGQYLQAL
jgi:hypothetical protein